MTGVHFPKFLGDIAIDDEAVVNEKFVTGLDGSDRMNKNPITGLDCLAVGCACMVQEAERALLPPRLPSITRPSDRPKIKVCPFSDCWRLAARRRQLPHPESEGATTMPS
ncbi:hypothetical protein OKW46_007286 [Paraburkholderia sp. WSM4179]|nr:hypothetical protein [Paraburkholderia sp. WSM4179]